MNLHTFKDVVTSKRSSLANDLEDDEDDNDETVVGTFKRDIDGEEDEGEDKFNEVGVAIEPFNMRDERDGGHIDDNMNYVFKQERGEIDAWVADLNEAEMEKAIGEAAMALKRKQDRMEKLERLQEERPKKSPLELKKELLTILKPGETIVKAMRRLGGKNDNELPEVRRRKPNNSNSVNKTLQLTKDQLAANRKIINRLTDIADDLFATKLIGVYDMTYEAIKSSTVLWEYKGLDGTIYGPYTSQQIADWKKQGFLTGLTAVQMRQVGSDSKFSDGNVPVGNKRKVAFEESAKVDSIYDEDVVVPKQLTASYKRLKADDGSSVAQETEVSIDDCNEWRSSDAIDFGVYIDLDANSTAVESAASNFNEEKEAASYPYGEVNDSDDD